MGKHSQEEGERPREDESVLSRRGFLRTVGGLGVVTAVGGAGAILTPNAAGASARPRGDARNLPSIPDSHVNLSLIGWAGGYDPSWVNPLQKQFNVTVTYKGVDSMVQLQTLVLSAPRGTYDIAGIYNHTATPILHAAGKLAPLQLSSSDFGGLLSYWRPSASRLRGPDIYGGKVYYATANADYQGIMFNQNAVSKSDLATHGYDILYLPKYKKKIVVWDDALQTMPLFGFLLGLDPFQVTNAQFAAMKAKMMALAPQVFLVPAAAQGVAAMADGSAHIIGTLQGSATLVSLLKEQPHAAVFYDKRGVLADPEGVSVLAGSKNPTRAQQFAKAWLNPKIQVDFAEKAAWSSPPTAVNAWKLLPARLVKDYAVRYDSALGRVVPKIGSPNWKLIEWIAPIKPTLETWLAAWAEFKAAIH